MGFGIGNGPEGVERHQRTFYIYDVRNGNILATHHFFGAAREYSDELRDGLTRQAHEGSGVPLEHIEVLSGLEIPEGEGPLHVNTGAKNLVRKGTIPRPIRA